MPVPAGPLPTSKVVRPNAGTVKRPVSGEAPKDSPGHVQ